MVIVEELAAEFEVQLAAEFADAVAYVLRLELEVLVVVKAYPVHINLAPDNYCF